MDAGYVLNHGVFPGKVFTKGPSMPFNASSFLVILFMRMCQGMYLVSSWLELNDSWALGHTFPVSVKAKGHRKFDPALKDIIFQFVF